MGNVGQKMRVERRKRGITLDELAKQSGLSKSFISQIERGLAQPSLASLKKLAPPLGHTVATIISDTPDVNTPKTVYSSGPIQPMETSNGYAHHDLYNNQPVARVISKEKRKHLRLPGCDFYYEIISPLYNSRAEVLFVRAKIGDSTGEELLCDQSERVGLVLKGSVEVYMRNGVHILKQGDSIHIPSHTHFKWTAIEGDVVEVIWVLTPPSF